MLALLSVSDKRGLVPFAQGLVRLGFELLSTGGTLAALQAASVPARKVSEHTQSPEILGGRVKTLHPRIHGGLLGRLELEADRAEMAAHGITPISLVAVNLYPFRQTVASGASEAEVIEQIDIGGPAMVRASAKNFRHVTVVVDPEDYGAVLAELEAARATSEETRRRLMRKAFAHTAEFDALIAQTLEQIECTGSAFQRAGGALQTFSSVEVPTVPLRYGENPHQQAVWGPLPAPLAWIVHQGKGLSYTNLLDLDAALRIVLEFTEPAATVIKHTNPCGTATGSSIADAYVRARDADALSAFGGIVGLNRPLDVDAATAITSTFIEAVIAPEVEDAARAILAKKANLRVVTVDFASLQQGGGQEMRSFLGGTLIQDRDRVTEAREPWPPAQPDASAAAVGQDAAIHVVSKRQPTAEEWTALRFAWRLCAHVKSNTIVFTTADRSLAIGAGQMSRVDAVKVAVMKAAPGSLKGSVAASDAFFPFRDGLDAVADAGATAVVQPGGSVKDAEVIAAADERGLAMVFTGRRHFRH